MTNPILKKDSYKLSHPDQLPEGTEFMSSYIEARYDNTGALGGWVPFMGLEPFLNDIQNKITKTDIAEAKDFAKDHGEPFNEDGYNYIVNKYGGYLPLRIRAIPEGTIVPVGVPQLEVINTDSYVPWLTSSVETALLRAIWYPSTVAAVSRTCKQWLAQALDDTVGNRDALPFMLHDFGARGVSSGESAEIGGAGHLLNFMGSDTMEAVMFVRNHYQEHMAGFSVPAAEHSTITIWGKDGETAAYHNMIKKFGKPGAIFSIVSDSYDIFNAVENIYGGTLRNEITALGDINAKLVIRPDSGDPKIMIPQLLEILARKFGHTINSKGFKKLPPYLGLLWGDGISLKSMRPILDAVKASGWAADNVVYGMGGGLLQHLNRDTLGYAMKASYATINGQGVDIYKETPGKQSKRGVQDCFWTSNAHGQEYLSPATDFEIRSKNLTSAMQVRYHDGEIFNSPKFSEMRERAAI